MSKGIRQARLGLGVAFILGAGVVHAGAPDMTWARAYNAQGLVESLDGPRTDVNDVTGYTYDVQGRLATVTDALGHVTTYGAYDSMGKPGTTTDANGVVTSLTYTPQEWPATITRDSTGTPSTTTLSYNAVGDLTQTQDADGVTLTYTYDDARRLTDITDGAGNHIHYTLDGAGNRTKEETFDASNTLTRSVSRTFTTLSQLLTLTDGLNHAVLRYDFPDGYDPMGHPTHSADGMGTERTQGYDALNRLVSAVDNAGGTDLATKDTVTAFSYDASDHLTGESDPDGLATTYTYDGLGHRTGLQSPDTGLSTDTFDAAGNRLVHTDAKGVVSTTAYDALNRPTSVSYTDATLDVAYHYDEANSVTGCATSAPVGRLTRIVESAVTTTYCYDPLGRVIQKRQVTASATDVTSYGYTLAGRLSQTAEPDGTVVSNTYDALGQLSSVQVSALGSSAQTVVSGMTYLPFGPVTSYTLGNGQVVTRTYDANYALTDLASPALNLHFARDALGRIVAEGSTAGASPATETYHYDVFSRLLEVDDASGSPVQSFTYNRTGDRLSKTGGIHASGTYTYTTGTHQLSGVGASSRSNDANGNTTGISAGGTAWGLGYNGRNRLTVVQADGATVGTYAYNALGQRIQKVVTLPSAATIRFAYDESSHLIGEYASDKRDYIWAGELPVAVVTTSGTTSQVDYVTADHLGTPRAITDASGTLVWQWAWVNNPFGEQAPTSVGGYTYNLRFPGQYIDAETGLSYNINRNYDSASGRYVESDPIGLDSGVSTYAYVVGNPLILIDDVGLDGHSAVTWAHSQIGKPGYGYFDPSEESRGRLQGITGGRGSFKCNKFVWDALMAGGDPAGRMGDGRIPSASEWGNPSTSISGYTSLPSDIPLLPGDVIGNGHHVGIYDPTSDGNPLTTSAAAPLTGGTGINGGVVNNDWGFRPGADEPTTATWRANVDLIGPIGVDGLFMGVAL